MVYSVSEEVELNKQTASPYSTSVVDFKKSILD